MNKKALLANTAAFPSLLLVAIMLGSGIAQALPAAPSPPGGLVGPQVGPAGVVLDSGATLLGVRNYGSLGVPGGPLSFGPCDASGANSQTSKCTTTVGLRIRSTQMEGVADGCVCEGWGISFTVGGTVMEGDVQPISATSQGVTNMQLASFTWGPQSPGAQAYTWARSIVDVAGMVRVTHLFSVDPATNVDGQHPAFRVNVTLQNISGQTITHLNYRRVVDFDAEPTAQREVVGYMLCNDIMPGRPAVAPQLPNQFFPSDISPGCDPLNPGSATNYFAMCGHPPSELTYLSSNPSNPTDPRRAQSAGGPGWGGAPAPFTVASPGQPCNQFQSCAPPNPPCAWDTHRMYNAVAGPGDLGMTADFNFDPRPHDGNPTQGSNTPIHPGDQKTFTMWFGAEKVDRTNNPASAAAVTGAETDVGSQDALVANVVGTVQQNTPVPIPLPFAPPAAFAIASNAVNCISNQGVTDAGQPATVTGPIPTDAPGVSVPYVADIVLPSSQNIRVPLPTLTSLQVFPLPFVTLPTVSGGPSWTMTPDPNAPPPGVYQDCQQAAGATVTPGNPATAAFTFSILPGSVLATSPYTGTGAPPAIISGTGSISGTPANLALNYQPSVLVCGTGATGASVAGTGGGTSSTACPGAAVIAVCAPGAHANARTPPPYTVPLPSVPVGGVPGGATIPIPGAGSGQTQPGACVPPLPVPIPAVSPNCAIVSVVQSLAYATVAGLGLPSAIPNPNSLPLVNPLCPVGPALPPCPVPPVVAPVNAIGVGPQLTYNNGNCGLVAPVVGNSPRGQP
ncbi:MAG: hypothetical protein ACYDBQ_08860, partial [Thermoplasmatota archaeon]